MRKINQIINSRLQLVYNFIQTLIFLSLREKNKIFLIYFKTSIYVE